MTANSVNDRSDYPPARAFTVFTPTYNRAHTLHRAYNSLRAQTFRDFEWLVIDDGSSDGTAALIRQWQQDADISIRYIAQSQSGKHVAHNRALDHACGELFTVLDSDDACTPTSLERILHHWNSIPEQQRSQFSGVAGLCCDQHGDIVGDRYPSEPLDISLREQRYVYRIRGEKWGADLTKILKRFRFPDVGQTSFMPEGVVWLEVAKRYKTRCVNEVFRVYYVNDPATGSTLTQRKSLGDGARGRLCYYTWVLNNDLEYFARSPAPFIKAAVMLSISALSASGSLMQAIGTLNSISARALVLSTLPAALVLYAIDRASMSRRRDNAAS